MSADADQAYLALCTQAGLSSELGQQSLMLSQRALPDPAELEQLETNFIRAYSAARAAVPVFTAQLSHFGQITGAQASNRPGGIKSLERLVEKYSLTEELPLDVLAGKAVASSLREMYRLAALVPQQFAVRGLRDRLVRPRASGYRDLQFIVDIQGQLAEFKIVHTLFDELDAYEHRLYEMRRSLEARTGSAVPTGAPTLSVIEALVLDKLIDVSADLFQQTWKLVLRREVEE